MFLRKNVNLIKLISGTLYYSIGLLLAYVIPYKVGGLLLGLSFIDNSTSLFFILNTFRWLLIILLALVVPYMLLTNSKLGENLQRITG